MSVSGSVYFNIDNFELKFATSPTHSVSSWHTASFTFIFAFLSQLNPKIPVVFSEKRYTFVSFIHGTTAPPVDQGLLIIEASWSQSDTPPMVGLLWTGDQSLPYNTQHSQQTDIHAPVGIRTHNPPKRVAADPHLRPRGHRKGPFLY